MHMDIYIYTHICTYIQGWKVKAAHNESCRNRLIEAMASEDKVEGSKRKIEVYVCKCIEKSSEVDGADREAKFAKQQSGGQSTECE